MSAPDGSSPPEGAAGGRSGSSSPEGRAGERNGPGRGSVAAAEELGAQHRPPPEVLRKGLGLPWLFAAIYSAVGFSIYFALGVVADRGLGLTPLIFLASGLLFVMTAMTYVEGGTMFRERGGSSTFARYAFNELVSFIAGWAILIDYLIVIALAAITVPHYLEPISGRFGDPGYEIGVAAAVIVLACALNIRDTGGSARQRILAGLALADVLLQVAVIVVGALAVWHPDRLTDQLDLFTSPSLVDVIYAAVLAMLAYAGIEAASNLAPDVEFEAGDLRRIVSVGAVAIPLVYAGMAAIALMAVPVVAGPQGPETALGSKFVEEPVLGVVSAYQPGWLADAMRWIVGPLAAMVLVSAATTSMLGVSRHVYTLAINRQIPSWLGKLNSRFTTPHVAILLSGLIALALVIPTDVKLLAGIYAFGATLALTIAHLSIIRLRVSDPEKSRPFRVPWNVPWRGREVPVPAILAAVLSALAFLSVLLYHDRARWVGGGWMAFGLVGYVVYRLLIEGTTLTERVSVTPEALTKEVPEVEFGNILVPVFGSDLDDDIVGTAGRLAAADVEEGEWRRLRRRRPDEERTGAKLTVLYVTRVPLSLPVDANLPERDAEAERVLERARQVAAEYENVQVAKLSARAREVGPKIVSVALDLGVEAIVLGGEPPSKIRGGAILGGIGAAKPPEIGQATEYVLKKAPCRVLLTAPPEDAGRAPTGLL
ncbi:MAG: amino acid permease [Solirubrobacterales bacterium]